MTTITIRIPDEGAIRLLEESIKAGVAPDRFVAMLIEERLKQSTAPATPSPPPETPAHPPQAPQLNRAGLKALERLFTNFVGMPREIPKEKTRKRKAAKAKGKA